MVILQEQIHYESGSLSAFISAQNTDVELFCYRITKQKASSQNPLPFLQIHEFLGPWAKSTSVLYKPSTPQDFILMAQDGLRCEKPRTF